MTRRIWAIALNTFRESIRQRMLLALLVAVLALILFAVVLGEMSYHEEARVARDVGVGAVDLFGNLIAIVLGILLLYTEIRKRTVHTIASKPIDRGELVLGKYLGMVLSLTVVTLVLGGATALLLRLQDVAFTGAIAKALLLSYVGMLVVAAIGLFFSSFSGPFLSATFTAGIWLIGKSTAELRAMVDHVASAGAEVHRAGAIKVVEHAGKDHSSPLLRVIGRVVLRVVPDLHMFSISGGTVDGAHVSVSGDFVTWSYVATAGAYGALYVVVLVALASIIFSRRDFV